ncbi:glycosyl hydrolase family 28-related protein [Paraburkholderia sp. BL17N1]|uniref:glycosyl hydrolase family 28-related protein n=1 Tax=Paraburkholderia sp. BL17N1 TaxID=1938798 RepID=UPI000EAE5255|nr:glycosyl hydrolase family 28-related protein [Paraburkholderia sp. BL17N1]RKR42658.1 pectate lyase-like protein [Paraburkholderia sp. BL17N1]
MTVPVQIPIISYQGNGVTTLFSFPFTIIESADLKTLLNGDLQAIGSQISLNGIGAPGGGSVAFAAPPALGSKIIIYRDVSIERDTDYQDNGDLLAATVNADFDRIWMALQDMSSAGARAIQYPVTEYTLDGTLPPAADRAGMLLGFDASGYQEMVPPSASIGAGDMRFEKGSDGNPGFKAGTDFTPDVSTSLTLSRAPINAANCWVYWDASPQLDFSLSGTTLTFPTPIPTGISRVYVRTGTTLSIGKPAQNSVGDDELIWGASLRRTVPTIAKLRANTDPRFQSFSVNGYYAAFDGPGGDYDVDPSDTTSLDNGGSIIVDALGRRVKLKGPPDWYVEQFGAKGDGATDDTAAIQAAINALPARGGYVRFMGKQYAVSNTIHVGDGNGGTVKSTKNGIKLIGQGAGFGGASPPPTNIQLLAKAPTGTPYVDVLINFAGAITNSYLQDMTVYCNLQANVAVKYTAACGIQMRNVVMSQYVAIGLWLQGGDAPTGNYNINNEFHNILGASTHDGHRAFFVDGNYAAINDTWLTSFYNCRFDTTSASGSYSGYFRFSDSMSFHRCHFVGDYPAVGGSKGIMFDAVGNNQYPGGHVFHDCSIISTDVNENDTDKIGIMSFINYGVDDHETLPAHTSLKGFTIHGTPFNGWGT